MTFKVVGIGGSYRKGKIIDGAVSAILEGVKSKGAETQKIDLLDKHIEFCTNCRSCSQVKGQGRGKCVHNDEMDSILTDIDNADAIVLGSPINFSNVTAIMKRFIERLIPYAYWPWGKAVCQSKLRLKRAPLARAMSEARHEVVMDSQTVRCSLYQDGGKPYVVEIALAPKVTFENGKATQAEINWGDVSAPMLIYPLLYAGTGLDNSSNVLGPEVVRMVNEFTGKECAKVKAELPGRGVN